MILLSEIEQHLLLLLNSVFYTKEMFCKHSIRNVSLKLSDFFSEGDTNLLFKQKLKCMN